ncbi:hypothetical protein BGZ70_004574 [Mortierella alpina]|uniref:Uncharacterized protein n=1 Tax=Mortierella alpina TaxID=64518 RepID=A0A9P6LV27_MORAP|nr:hypothetical protein BGZ70_004574 [Mortierella alpina]
MTCMAVVCEFTYIRRQSPGNIIKRSASCYWADRNAAQCSSAADSLYKTLGSTYGPFSVRCKYTHDVDLFGWAYFEFDKFNSACKGLGGSNAFPQINADSDAKCENPNNNPDALPFVFQKKYVIKGAATNRFWRNYLGEKDGKLAGTDDKWTVIFRAFHTDDATKASDARGYSRDPYDERMYKDSISYVTILNAGGTISVENGVLTMSRYNFNLIQVEAIAGGAYIFKVEVDSGDDWGYIQDVEGGTFIVGNDKEAAAQFLKE